MTTHDSRYGLHLGVILSGATTFFSSFFACPLVSFYLAQCAIRRERCFSVQFSTSIKVMGLLDGRFATDDSPFAEGFQIGGGAVAEPTVELGGVFELLTTEAGNGDVTGVDSR